MNSTPVYLQFCSVANDAVGLPQILYHVISLMVYLTASKLQIKICYSLIKYDCRLKTWFSCLCDIEDNKKYFVRNENCVLMSYLPKIFVNCF